MNSTHLGFTNWTIQTEGIGADINGRCEVCGYETSPYKWEINVSEFLNILEEHEQWCGTEIK